MRGENIMKVTLYASYGVLAHEKKAVYKTHSVSEAVSNDKVDVIIPDDLHPYVTQSDDIAVVMDGTPYLLNDALTSDRSGRPAIRVYERNGKSKTVTLKYCEENL